jgi:cytochrome c oxidase subunit 4
MSDHDSHLHDIKPYLFVFGALLVLTVVTVLVSYWHLPPGPAILVGLFIATVKASLVAAFFMHLKNERVIIYGLLGITTFFAIILFTIPITDSNWTSDRRPDKPAVAAQAEAAEASSR